MKKIIFSFALLFCFSCGNDVPTEKPEILPNTPEAVAKLWQKYVDTDQFLAAKEISTPRAQEWLTMIEKFLKGLPAEETAEPINTIFTQFNCQENGDSAACAYVIAEEGEIIQDTFFLLKMDGQWKVDVPEELEEEDAGDLKEYMDSLMLGE